MYVRTWVGGRWQAYAYHPRATDHAETAPTTPVLGDTRFASLPSGSPGDTFLRLSHTATWFMHTCVCVCVCTHTCVYVCMYICICTLGLLPREKLGCNLGEVSGGLRDCRRGHARSYASLSVLAETFTLLFRSR